jgi:uncharacterized protein YjiS (DUF1127 family)
MAAFDTSRPMNSAHVGGSIFKTVSNAFGTLAAWNDTRVTRKALSALSTRELDDIGLTRDDIAAIARR